MSEHMLDDETEESGADTCAICLARIAADEAFLDRCYHRFHFQCLLRWTDTQGAHPAEEGPSYCCPLCKAAYSSILYGLHGTTFRQHWVLPQHQLGPSFLSLNPQQLRRRSLYSGAQSVTSVSAPSMRKPPVAPSEVQAWVQRELQAVTLEDDVKVVSQVVLRAMTLLEQSLSSQGTRTKRSTLDMSLLTPQQQQEWQCQMSDAVKPFIPDHASEFAHQLLSFIGSKLTVQGHDRAVFGDIPNEPVHQVQPVHQSDDDAEQGLMQPSEHSSSASPSGHNTDDVSDTDSEGYLSLLQAQRSRQYSPHPGSTMRLAESSTLMSNSLCSDDVEGVVIEARDSACSDTGPGLSPQHDRNQPKYGQHLQ